MPESLTLKSIVPSSSSQTPANAVLCTDNQTYQVRQVHSSNSIYVLQPCETSLGYDSIPTEGLSAISQCTTTLELIPAPSSATIFLKQTLPAYNEPENCTQPSTASTPLGKRSKCAVFEHAPFSLGEFNKACEDLCVFEVNGQAWLPTASTLANLWSSTISGATMRDVNLGESFSIATLSGIAGEDGHPIALFKAVMDRLSSNDSDLMDDGKLFLTDSTLDCDSDRNYRHSPEQRESCSLGRTRASPVLPTVCRRYPLVRIFARLAEPSARGLENPRYAGRVEGTSPQSLMHKFFAKRQ